MKIGRRIEESLDALAANHQLRRAQKEDPGERFYVLPLTGDEATQLYTYLGAHGERGTIGVIRRRLGRTLKKPT